MKNKILIALLKKEMKELFRSGKLIVFAAVFLFFGLLSPIAAKYLPQIISSIGGMENIQIKIPEPTWLDAVAQYVKNLTQLCTFIVIVIFMGYVAREKESGTAVFLLVKPVPRGSFLAAKFISAILTLLISLFVAFVAAAFYTLLFFDGFSLLAFFYLNLVMLLYLGCIICMTIMFSTILRSMLLAGIFSFLGWLLLALISQLGSFGKFSPSFLISQAGSLMASGNVAWQPVVGAFVFIIFTVGLSYSLFRKWET
jgi:ABC-2 type transport system permease protein